MKQEEDTENVRLVMTLLVRDEEDIIRQNIEFHLSKGVDYIIATDNASIDGTRDILEEYVQKRVLHLIDEPGRNKRQADWVNRMAKIAYRRYGADIIFHCDADEFWHPRSGNLKNEISRKSSDVLRVEMVNVPLARRNGEERFPEDTRFAVVSPIDAEDYQAQTTDRNLYLFKYPSKVMFKTGKRLFEVTHGNHFIRNKDDSVAEEESSDIRIYHYPVRNKEQFLSKVVNSGSSYERNKRIRKSRHASFHLRRWYEMHKIGLLDEEYEKVLLDENEIEDLIREGRIEEFSFSKMLSGCINEPVREISVRQGGPKTGSAESSTICKIRSWLKKSLLLHFR